MDKYEITITETLERKVLIKANSYDEALDIVKEKYNNEEIVLDSTYYVETVIH